MIEVNDLGRGRRQRNSLLIGDDVNPLTGRLMSIAQLQQVLRERALGEVGPVLTDPKALNGPVMTVPGAGLGPVMSARLPRPCVMVVGAQAGQGCTVTALALAEAATHQAQVHLVETPHRAGHRSGLSAVTHHELGVAGDGWARGRRTDLIIDRVPGGERMPQSWPPAAPATTLLPPSRVLVIDGGPVSAQSWWADPARCVGIDAVVVVCRPTPTSVSAAEDAAAAVSRLCSPADLMAGSEGGLLIVAASISGARWRGRVAAAGGPLLHAAIAERRVIAVPASRYLEAGPTTGDLPRGVSAAGRHLWAALAARLPALTAPTGPGVSSPDPSKIHF